MREPTGPTQYAGLLGFIEARNTTHVAFRFSNVAIHIFNSDLGHIYFVDASPSNRET